MRFLPIYFSLAFLSACYEAETTQTDSLLYCLDKAPDSFNPQISHDVATLDATTNQLFNRLVKIDPISQRFIPDIAHEWQINNDKTKYTFFLRKDVNFHQNERFTPSRKLNANDVIFSFKRMLSDNHPYHAININADTETYLYNHPFSNLVTKIVKVDNYTIQFNLNKPDASLLANLAAHYAVIHSQEYALKLLQSGHPEEIDYFPIGTGPFQLKTNSTNRVIRYEAHHNPWQKPVSIKNLIYDITPNATKRYAKLLSGECDIITNPASSQVTQISRNSSVSLSSHPTGNVALLAFNSKAKDLNSAEIRQAISHAIDQKTIIDAVFFETAEASDHLLPNQSWAYNPRTEKVRFSPEESIQELQKNEFDFSRTLRILAPIKNSIFNPNFYKTAELIQSNLTDVGVSSVIVQLRQAELQAALLSGDYDLFLTGISPYIKDPDNLFRPLLSCNANPLEGNTSQWCDDNIQSLLDDTLLETNFIQRVKNYYQLQEQIQSQRIYLPIAHLLRFDVFNQNISGLQIDPLTGINFDKVQKTPPIHQVMAQ
ncbi:ABC transporter substrate-binding protein [Psychromonas sp. psych-6C06]|uniref:ABC transporter substrate-binding protein n=1 Tax=Psychromonas sp. psych-6C06 TaxID=2058089 RepID=UPI000C34E5F0|nr:ABC transporter substrate-binding protein [Psychromonas sp. psych-6C06]PKF61083.1 ABC transporter substrate-binding protein [Psychromonas sp. psych-6C06]